MPQSADLLNCIEQTQDAIFEFNTILVSEKINLLINLLPDILEKANNQLLNDLNRILGYINIALQNKDYLLLADILEYELKPKVTGQVHIS